MGHSLTTYSTLTHSTTTTCLPSYWIYFFCFRLVIQRSHFMKGFSELRPLGCVLITASSFIFMSSYLDFKSEGPDSPECWSSLFNLGQDLQFYKFYPSAGSQARLSQTHKHRNTCITFDQSITTALMCIFSYFFFSEQNNNVEMLRKFGKWKQILPPNSTNFNIWLDFSLLWFLRLF